MCIRDRRVNVKKTQLLCVSGATDAQISSFIDVKGGSPIATGTKLKIPRFIFGQRLNVSDHVVYIRKKFNARAWTIWNLKRAGVTGTDLLELYNCLVCPIIEFATPAYHSLLSLEQSEDLERLQRRIFKVIFGWNYSYRSVLEHYGLKTLKERREESVLKFAQKTADNPRFKDWFKKNPPRKHKTRRNLLYQMSKLKKKRGRKNPLNYMRELLNIE